MNSVIKNISFSLLFVLIGTAIYAGNPDRQGEAGAGELLFNPWARSAGLHTMNTSSIAGVDAMRLNVAGLGRISGSELVIANTRLYEGAGIKLNALGYAQKSGENGAFGISLTSVSFGDIPITTTLQPEGTGGTFSPSFFHLGLGYSYTYANKISVGLLLRGISEALPDVSAFGFAIDAGVQYVSGEQDNFKLGISLRNIGAPMQFSGEGLAYEVNSPGNSGGFPITFESRSENFELPSALNIGISYDFYLDDDMYLRALSNFTSNSFSSDQIGVGAEFFVKNLVVLRGGYKYSLADPIEGQDNLYTGVAGGISVNVPFKKGSNKRIGIDYAFRATNTFNGTHNFSVRLTL